MSVRIDVKMSDSIGGWVYGRGEGQEEKRRRTTRMGVRVGGSVNGEVDEC